MKDTGGIRYEAPLHGGGPEFKSQWAHFSFCIYFPVLSCP